MTTSKPTLSKSVQAHLAPALRRDGFLGTGQRYVRTVGQQIQIVEVQASRYGGQFAVNMGIQPLSIPADDDRPIDPKRLREMDCLFRRRLSGSGTDQWWSHWGDQASMDQAVQRACRIYDDVGRHQLARMSEPASPLYTTRAKDFESNNFNFEGFGDTALMMAWALAHMRLAAGNKDEARAFATWALKKIGIGPGGVGLKSSLEALLARA